MIAKLTFIQFRSIYLEVLTKVCVFKTLCLSLLFKKFVGFQVSSWKQDSSTGLLAWILQNFYEHFFVEHTYLKLVPAIFYQFFIFHCFLFHWKSFFRSRDIQIFVTNFFSSFPHFPDSKWKWNNLWCQKLTCINLQM